MNTRYFAAALSGFFLILFLGLSLLFTPQPEDETIIDSVVETIAQPTEDPGQIYIDVEGYEIALWPQNDQLYAFLPSACKETDTKPKLPEETDPDSIIWMYSKNIPAVFIDTESGTMEQINADKNIKETGKVSVLNQDGVTSFRMPLTYIKSRGNTSFTSFDKKSYQIRFVDSSSFLGMDSAKKWIFTANAPDATLLRNALSRNLADHLHLPQSEEGVFVDLYLNGEYAGNYYVTEKVEVQKNRLTITDLEEETEIANGGADLSVFETAWTDTTKAKQIPEDPEDITGGYLIERDFNDRFLKEVEINGSYFITQDKESFILRAPEYASENQIAYINDFVQSVENAILSPDGNDPVTGKSYLDLIDLDSFVRKYLLEEVTANYDGGVASSYFYKDIDSVSEKLFAGPIWDYDVTWGNSPAYLGHISSSPDRLSKLHYHTDSSSWFAALYDKQEFYEKMISTYQEEISAYLQTLAAEILPKLAEMTAASAAMDQTRWAQQYIENGTTNSRESEITFLSEYILRRKEFLDKAWIEQFPVHQIDLLIEGAQYDTLYVFDGDPMPVIPDAEISYAKFLGWTSETDASVPDSDTRVYEDMVFHAILQYE